MIRECANLIPRVLRLFGQQLVARRDSGVLEFYYRRISAVKQWKPLRSLYRAANQKNLNFFQFSRVSPGAYPLTKKPEDSGYEIGSAFDDLELDPGLSPLCLSGMPDTRPKIHSFNQRCSMRFGHQSVSGVRSFYNERNFAVFMCSILH